MTGRKLKSLTEEEIAELRRIRNALDKIIPRDPNNQILIDMEWMLTLLERFE